MFAHTVAVLVAAMTAAHFRSSVAVFVMRKTERWRDFRRRRGLRGLEELTPYGSPRLSCSVIFDEGPAGSIQRLGPCLMPSEH